MVDTDHKWPLYITPGVRSNSLAHAPIPLPPNLIPRFYRGGPRIGRFRNLAAVGDHESEDWIGSTTTTRASDRIGLTILESGEFLREAVASDPISFLGADHAAAYGPSPGMLLKLLDAGERLPVHCHPSRDFARHFLHSEHGKTEAWHVLEAEPGARVYLGFRRALDFAELAELVAEQRAGAILDLLNPVEVRRGETVFVPGGLPHSIGEGLLIVEVQEPTDHSVILEWAGFDIDAPSVGHLRLGYDTALGAVDRTGWDTERIDRLIAPAEHARGIRCLLPDDSLPYFRLERVAPEGDVELPPAFSLLVVTDGTGGVRSGAGELKITSGDTLLIPHAAGRVRVEGRVEILRCLGPAPNHVERSLAG
jgi:mannose-6-phosphate isomerase